MANPYAAILRSRIDAQRQYKQSFRFDLFGSVMIALLEIIELLGIFGNTKTLGGLNFGAAVLVFVLSRVSWGIADMTVGHLDRLPGLIRSGELDAFLLRPLPVLPQLMVADFALPKLGRFIPTIPLFVIALFFAGVPPTWHSVAVLTLAIISGVIVFSAIFVIASGLQFFLIDGAEFTNSFVYGGNYVSTMPTSIFAGGLRVVFGFILPMAFIGYLPTILAFGIDGPAGLPNWLGWLTPVAALWAVGLAALSWKFGLRHYKGTGS